MSTKPIQLILAAYVLNVDILMTYLYMSKIVQVCPYTRMHNYTNVMFQDHVYIHKSMDILRCLMQLTLEVLQGHCNFQVRLHYKHQCLEGHHFKRGNGQEDPGLDEC